jgi:hypothetical protein
MIYRIIILSCVITILVLTFLMYGEHKTRINAEQRRNELQSSLIQTYEICRIDSLNIALRGRNLEDLLDVPKSFYDNVNRQHNLQRPYLVLAVKEIDCSSCYNQETESIHELVQQHIPVMVLAFQEADFINHDFKQRIVLFPPPFTQTFLRNLSAKMALLWVSPDGLILDAEIPSIRFPDRSKKFYERIRRYHNSVSKTNGES